MRPSSSTIAAIERTLAERRDQLVREWADWISSRVPASAVTGATLAKQIGLLVDIFITLTGSLRRPATQLWLSATEWYGRSAADRGLATGEVVEEFQFFRELLTRELSERIATMTARQAMTSVLRLNRQLDRGLAHAVVGYTDALVETLLHRQGIPVSASEVAEHHIGKRLAQLRSELEALRTPST